MVSKLVTTRSIWRSALLISLLVGCGSSRPAPLPAPTPAAPTPAAPSPLAAPAPVINFADVVFINGDVFGPAGHTTALAQRGTKLAKGDPQSLIGPNTRVIDLEGRSVIVGLTDAHCHLYGLGVDLENVSVRNAASEADAVKLVVDAAKTRPVPRAKRGNDDEPGGEAEWLVGRGWDQNKWPGQKFPSKASLDAAISDRPVLLRRIDGHAAWVNSKALAAAGITKATKDPAGGKILRDKKGNPTGVLVDNAMDLVDSKMPTPSPETIERRILAAAKIVTELGFTAVHEMGIDWATAAVYEKLATDDKLPLRVYAYLSGDPKSADELRTRKPKPAVGRFVMNGVKFFADGALGSRGARLYEDYSDDKGSRGLWVTEPDLLAKAVDSAVAGQWDVAIHAIGDAGIGSVLDAFTSVHDKHSKLNNAGKPNPPLPVLRVEHVQVIAAKDIDRMVAIGAIASMQPTHATSDMPWAEARVGKERIKGAYAWRTMLNKKIPLAFGSDFPVEEVDPLLGLYAAVTRTSPQGQPSGGWYPDQKLTLDEAVAAFTVGTVAALPLAFVAVQIADAPADFTIFDGKLTESDLLKRKVAMTVVDGKFVYSTPGLTLKSTKGGR